MPADPTLPSEEELRDLETAATWAREGLRSSVSVTPSVMLSLIAAARQLSAVQEELRAIGRDAQALQAIRKPEEQLTAATLALTASRILRAMGVEESEAALTGAKP
jgi:uncharacterized protein (DUF1800 family)